MRVARVLTICGLTAVAWWHTQLSCKSQYETPTTGHSSTGALKPAFEIAPWIVEDGSLRAVHFIDADRGWAVGDFGLILRTQDGGTNWLRQESGVRCNLLDITFVSPQVGYVVGGWFESDTGLSRGVLLRTTDGGETWNFVNSELPQLQQIWSWGGNGSLVVFGQWSTLHQGRVLYSSDRGTNWASVDGERIADSRFVDVDGPSIYIVDGQGVVYRTDDPQRPPVATSVVGPVEAFAAGSGALVVVPQQRLAGPDLPASDSMLAALLSQDQGRHWQPVTVSQSQPQTAAVNSSFSVPRFAVEPSLDKHSKPGLPPGQRDRFLTAAIGPDRQAWLAGISGGRIMRIAADGTYTEFDTRTSLPIHDVFFLDNFRGWAAGAYGTILATRDGGQTWRSQRLSGSKYGEGQEKRAMLLGVANHPLSLPWSALAIQSLESTHRVAMAVASEAPVEDPLRANLWSRCRDAALRIGAGEVVQWQTSNIDAMLQSYRPSVLALGDDLSEQQVQAWIDASIRNGVVRVFQVTSEGRGDVTLVSSAILPVAAAITADFWNAAVDVIEPHYPIKPELKLRRRLDQSQADVYRNGLADGVANHGTVRSAMDGRRRNLQVLQARSGERVLIDRLLREATQISMEELDKRLQLLLSQTPRSNQLPMLRSVLMECQAQGDRTSLRLYIAGLTIAAEQYPSSPLGHWARMRYEAINTSAEWKTLLSDPALLIRNPSAGTVTPTLNVPAYASPFERLESGDSISSQDAFQQPQNGFSKTRPSETISQAGGDSYYPHPNFPHPAEAGMTSDAQNGTLETGTLETGNVMPANWAGDGLGAPLRQDLQFTSDQDLRLPALRPYESDLYWKLHPALLLRRGRPVADLAVNDEPAAFDQMMREKLAGNVSALAWRRLAAKETAQPIFATAAGGIDAATGHSKRPLLDGILDDTCWNPTAQITSAYGSEQPKMPVEVRFAYDAEFLYMAIAGIFSDDDVEAAVRKRNRDDDLSDQPHVVVSIDTDCDLMTSFELAVDRLGRTRESCDGFKDWQPTWYVTTKLTGRVRTVEAAIRRADLVALPPVRGDKWRVKLELIPPGGVKYRPSMPRPEGWRDLLFD